MTVNEKDSDNNSDLKNVNLNTDGEPNSASFDLNLSTNQTLIAKNHNHPENSPPSSTDIRSMIGSNSGTSSFVYGKGGNTYALVVTNATKATAFLTKYSDEDIYIMIINRAAIIINEIGSYDDFNPIYEKATQGILSGNGLELFKEGSGGYFQKSQ